MGMINVGKENSTPIDLYYEDHGAGTPVVLIHGWPLSGTAWEKQTAALLAAGHRVITYDRRGFGGSSKPGIGYNYDTFAADLDALLNALDLTDVSLVGHSMGTGEITRYIGKYGTRRLRKAVLIGTLGPYLVKAPDNPDGVDPKVFDDTRAGIKADRGVALMEFLKNFYSVGGADGKRVSERVIEANWAVAIGASPIGTLACIDSWIEDFRKDIARNDLGVDINDDIANDRIQRIGFTASGVSLNNRVYERHRTQDGGYLWVSYDFDSSFGSAE